MKAKTKFTKLWSILLALAIVVGMLPTMVLAAGSESADFVSNPTTALALLNAAKTGTKDSTWDGDTKTLTLNGVNFTTTATTAVKLPDGAVIVLNGENIIKGGNSNSGYCSGIYGVGDLTISGGTTVRATGGKGNLSNGIRAVSGSVSIQDTAVVTAQAGAETSYSYGIIASGVSITGGEVKATGSTGIRSCGIFSSNNVTISGGEVEATGGATKNGKSNGICADGSASITGGSLIAQGKTSAMNQAPSLPGAYQWRTSATGTYTKNTETGYSWDESHKYLEIKTATGFTVTFDANGGTGTMTDVTGVMGEYTLPANGFTAPTGMKFKCWSVDGVEKAVGSTINVTANTTVTAIWEAIEYNVTVSGTVTSFGSDTDNVILQLIAEGCSEADYEVFVQGNTASYTIEGVATGTYTMKVMKKNHVTREYTVIVGNNSVIQDVKIHHFGDINGDGVINAQDALLVLKAAVDKHTPTAQEQQAGDVNADGTLDASDALLILKKAVNKIQAFPVEA